MRTKTLRLILVIILFLITLDIALAIGITPAQTTLTYKEGESYQGRFTVIPSSTGPTKISFAIEGELKDYISINPQTTTINGPTEISFSMINPSTKLEMGNKVTKIYVSEENLESGMMSAKASVHHTINFIIPYTGQYIDTDLLIDEASNQWLYKFIIVMDNLGSEPVGDIKSVINIYSGKDKIATIYKGKAGLAGSYDVIISEKRIEGTTKPKLSNLPEELFYLNISKNYDNMMQIRKASFLPGEYIIKSYVKYADIVKTKEKTLRVGTEEVYIDSLTGRVRLNNINKLTLTLSSNWNLPLEKVEIIPEVYKDGEKIASLASPKIEIKPEQNTTTSIFYEPKDLAEGTYQIKVTARYDGLTSIRDFTFIIEPAVPVQQPGNIQGKETIRSMIANTMIIINLFITMLIIIVVLIIMFAQNKKFEYFKLEFNKKVEEESKRTEKAAKPAIGTETKDANASKQKNEKKKKSRKR